MIRIKM